MPEGCILYATDRDWARRVHPGHLPPVPPRPMPGTLVILSVMAVIAIAAWLAAWTHTRDPANHDAREDFRRLQRHAAWLEQRLDLARREKWGAEMITSLSIQLGEACHELSRARGGVIERTSARVR
jgi:hypothetical protein